MRRLLLDHNAPRGIGGMLPDYDVTTAYEMGWDELVNGRLLAAAEAAGFDIMVTGDQNLQHQQNLAGRRLAIVALGNTNWPVVSAHPEALQAAVAGAGEGSYTLVSFPRPRLIRRPAPPGP